MINVLVSVLLTDVVVSSSPLARKCRGKLGGHSILKKGSKQYFSASGSRSLCVHGCRSDLFRAHVGHPCSNQNCIQEFHHLRHYIASLEASVASQREEIHFLRDRDTSNLIVISEDSESRETDTDPAESETDRIQPKALARTFTESIDESSAISTPTADDFHPRYRARTLASVSTSTASQSLRSLCAATSTTMVLGTPSTSTATTVDPLATPD